MKILSISSSRADVGIMAPVWQALAAEKDLELCVLLTGMHLVDDKAARAAIPEAASVYCGGADLGGGGRGEAARAMGAISAFVADVNEAWNPDLTVAVGDRLDMIPGVLATIPFDVPIAHLHGGELTYGAVDNDIRHAMTKLAHLHCTASVEAASRLSEMGEEAWRIHVTGGPGLDMILNVPELSAEEFASQVGLASVEGLRLVTVHSETRAPDPTVSLEPVLAALATDPAPTLFTAPNSDPGGARIRSRIDAFVEQHSWCVFQETLGSKRYANALRHAAVMIGNSSSGLIEAPLFGLPVINIGDRQEGRQRAANVCDCAADAPSIALCMKEIQQTPRRTRGVSPYGDGKSGPRIARVLKDAVGQPNLLRKRHSTKTTDFKAPWSLDEQRADAG